LVKKSVTGLRKSPDTSKVPTPGKSSMDGISQTNLALDRTT
jgi:hypothetical protein